MGQYDDILRHPHYIDAAHQPMSMMSRAAQFSAFAALTGYEEAVAETARLTDQRHILTEDEQETLNAVMQQLADGIRPMPLLSVTYFVPDPRKDGGSYETVRGRVRFLDTDCGLLRFEDGRTVPLRELMSAALIPEISDADLTISKNMI